MKKCMMILAIGCLFYGIQTEAKLSSKEEAELRKAMIDYKKTSDPKKRAGYQKTIDKYAQKYPNDPLVRAKLNEKARFDQVQKPNVPAAKPQPVKPAAKPAMPAKPMPVKPQPVSPQRPVGAFVPVPAESLINKSEAEQDAVFARMLQQPSITRDMRVDYYNKYAVAKMNQFANQLQRANVQFLFDIEGNPSKEFKTFIPTLKNVIANVIGVKHKLGIFVVPLYASGTESIINIALGNSILRNLMEKTPKRYVKGPYGEEEVNYFYSLLGDMIRSLGGEEEQENHDYHS